MADELDQSPDEGLTQGLAALVDSGEGKAAEDASTGAGTDGAAGDRATQDDADAVKGEGSANADVPRNGKASNASPDKGGDNGKNGAVDQRAKGRPTAQDRIRELAAENKRLKDEHQKARDLAAQPAKKLGADGKPLPDEPRVIVPAPVKPQYSMEQLAKLKQSATAEGNAELLQAVQDEIEAWRDYRVNYAAWDIKNGHAVREYEQKVVGYRQQALTKYPELKDSNSPVFKTFQRVCSTFPELLNRTTADGEYYAAELAGILVEKTGHDAALGALREENKKLMAENAKLKGKMGPSRSRGAEETGGASDDDDPDVAFSRNLREIAESRA